MFNEKEIVSFQEESYQEIVEDIKPLIEKHWREIALHQDHIELEPDFEKYKQMADLGTIRFFAAREGKELVGYFVVMVIPHMHYKSHIFALNDILYVKKDSRALGTGKRLIEFSEQVLKNDGVSVIMINTKVHQPFDPLMEALGYGCSERVYSKYIGDK